MTTITITLKPDPANEKFHRVSLQIDAAEQVYYDQVINALMAVLDKLINEKYEQAKKSDLSREQSEASTGAITGSSIDNESGSELIN